jgi:hypothetical protein
MIITDENNMDKLSDLLARVEKLSAQAEDGLNIERLSYAARYKFYKALLSIFITVFRVTLPKTVSDTLSERLPSVAYLLRGSFTTLPKISIYRKVWARGGS